MRKNGWAAAAGLASLVLLLTACGGSSSSSTGGSGSSPTAAGLPTGLLSPGTTVLIVQKSNLGYVLAEANGQVVYVYSNDKKGGAPTCTNSCAASWVAVTGLPQASIADTLPGKLGTVTAANGAKQITYNGYPLYTFKGAPPLSTEGNGVGGAWHVVPLSASDITFGSS